MLERRTGLTPDHIQKYDIPELVVLRAKGEKKGKLKRDIDYPETHQIKRMRDQLKSYNKMLDAADITINPSFELPDGSSHNLNNKSYHRVFNRGSFELGGRYTGPWWQNASKAIRGQILIEGKSTVECRSEEHTSELQSRRNLVCRLLLEKKKKHNHYHTQSRTPE